MSEQKEYIIKQSRPTLLDMLAILFIALKLTNTVDWSWWIVLSPILVPLALTGLLLFVSGIVLLYGIIRGK